MRKSPAIVIIAAVALSAACNRDEEIDRPIEDGEQFRRPTTETSRAQAATVFEYTPAPGQFINETRLGGFDGSETTPEAAAAYALRRMSEGEYVSLGGFGGYIVVGFDHSIDNDGDYNISVEGNSMETSSEPGVVWVMRDENGDGLPNDTWYELKGSEYGKEGTLQEYSVTYFRPEADKQPVKWCDNLGNEGEIDWLKLHNQPSYYPAWIEADSYTLTGTRLEPRNYQEVREDGTLGNWISPPYDWGYADNFSPIDRLTDDDNYEASAMANHFKISNAVTADGKAANLKFIDFVKVQTAVNTKSGALGECSTEVIRISDFNMTKGAK
ncbi:MAG: hypothetical protein J6K28_05875 [Alistipes sp.]|nr:hypothetical protein [Alistipes sp.]